MCKRVKERLFINQSRRGSRTVRNLECSNILEGDGYTLVTGFPALSTGYMFSRPCYLLHVFPHLPPVTCFPALSTGYMFSRTCHRLHVFIFRSDWFSTLLVDQLYDLIGFSATTVIRNPF